MKRKEMIRDIYKVSGVLEGLTCSPDMTESVSITLIDCVDRLELIGAQLVAKDVQMNEKPTETFGRVYPSPLEAGTD